MNYSQSDKGMLIRITHTWMNIQMKLYSNEYSQSDKARLSESHL